MTSKSILLVIFFGLKLFTRILLVDCENRPEFIFRDRPKPLLEHITRRIQQVEFRLISKPQCTLKISCSLVIGIQVSKLDPTVIFSFQPMHDGCHGTAGTSGKAEEFHQLQPVGCKVDSGWVRGFQI